jgi:flagellin
MPIRIFNNIPSLNAQRILGINNDRLATSVERISSGLRINRAADDAAGLAISVALRSDLRALRQAVRNANDGISLINVTEGALNEQSGILIRLRELASQAATGTVGSTERQTIQLEFDALRLEMTASPIPPSLTDKNWSMVLWLQQYRLQARSLFKSDLTAALTAGLT